MTTRYYCTLFDSRYLAKGLALYFSLRDHSSSPFHLYILCMDDDAYRLLSEMNLDYVTLLPLYLFETEMKLATIRAVRTWQEYCWTCASQLMSYILSVYKPDMLTYLDADLFFFRDPEIIFSEIADKSIAIVPHNRAPHAKHSDASGIFNVGWVTIRNSHAGLACLSNWMHNCRVWCYARHEPGRFADQVYLDRWPVDFPADLCIISNRGVNAAPWNLLQYSLSRDIHGPIIEFNGLTYPVVFYHFHQYRDRFRLSHHSNPLPHNAFIIYEPYNAIIQYAQRVIERAEEKRRESEQRLRAEAERA